MTYFIVAYDKNKMIVSKTETTDKEIAIMVSNKYNQKGYGVKFFSFT